MQIEATFASCRGWRNQDLSQFLCRWSWGHWDWRRWGARLKPWKSASSLRINSIKFEVSCLGKSLNEHREPPKTGPTDYGRASQPAVHVPRGLHLPIWRGTRKVSDRRGKHIQYIHMLFICKYLNVCHWILFKKIVVVVLLNIFYICHDKIF